MQIDHFVRDRPWCAEASQRAALLFIEGSNATEAAIPRTTPAAKNGGGGHRMPLVVNRLPIRQGQSVQVLHDARQRCDRDFIIALAERDSRQAAPIRSGAETIQNVDQRHFTVESHDRVQTWYALENLSGFKTGVVT